MAFNVIIFLFIILLLLFLFMLMILNNMDTNLMKIRESLDELKQHQMEKVPIYNASAMGESVKESN